MCFCAVDWAALTQAISFTSTPTTKLSKQIEQTLFSAEKSKQDRGMRGKEMDQKHRSITSRLLSTDQSSLSWRDWSGFCRCPPACQIKPHSINQSINQSIERGAFGASQSQNVRYGRGSTLRVELAEDLRQNVIDTVAQHVHNVVHNVRARTTATDVLHLLHQGLTTATNNINHEHTARDKTQGTSRRRHR